MLNVLAALLIFLFNSNVLLGGPPLRPTGLGTMGALTSHPAMVYSDGAQVLYLREDRFRRQIPMTLPTERAPLEELLLQNYAYLTLPQLDWIDVLMTIETPSTTHRTIFLPDSYGRASIAGFHSDPQSLLAYFSAGEFGYDNKGTGITVLTERKQQITMDIFRAMMGIPIKEYNPLDEENIQLLRNWLESARSGTSELRKSLMDGEPEERKVKRFRLSNLESEIAVLRAFETSLEEIQQNGKATETQQLAFKSALSKMDYTNGLFEAARGVRELIVAELIEEVYGVLNEQWGTSLGVVPIDYVLALPVHMHSLQYRKSVRAGVLGRHLHYRANFTYLNESTPRFFWPKELVFSVLPGGEQFDINGHHIDLELINLNVPGIEDIFAQDLIYGYKVDRLALEVTQQALEGNREAIPQLIAKLRAQVDKQALVEWARKNKPKTNKKLSAFETAQNILDRAGSDTKPLDPFNARRLKEALSKMRKANESDKLSALMFLLVERAPEEANDFWNQTIAMIKQLHKEVEKAVKRGKEQKLKRAYDFRFIGHLIGSFIFDNSTRTPHTETKQNAAKSLYLASHSDFLDVYSSLGTEYFRRVAASYGVHLEGFYEGHPHYFLFSQIMARVCSTAMGELTGTSFEDMEINATLSYHEQELNSIRVLSAMMQGEPQFMSAFIHTIEHILGISLSHKIIQTLFPQHFPLLAVQQEFSRRLSSMSSLDQVRCMAELFQASGLLEDNTPPSDNLEN